MGPASTTTPTGSRLAREQTADLVLKSGGADELLCVGRIALCYELLDLIDEIAAKGAVGRSVRPTLAV
jgi:hypothetical protein